MRVLKVIFLTALITIALAVLVGLYLYGTQYQIVCSEGKAYKVNRMTGEVWLLGIGGQRKVGTGQPLTLKRFICSEKEENKEEEEGKVKIRSYKGN